MKNVKNSHLVCPMHEVGVISEAVYVASPSS